MALDFLNDLGKKLTQAGQEAAQQTKIFAETAKINGIISDEEKQINNIYMQIGKSYFEENKDNPNAMYSDLIVNVKDALVRVEKYKEQIRAIKGVKVCRNCGAEVVSNAAFCNSCGMQMPVEAPVSTEQTGKICPQCGSLTAEDSSFCTVCGCNLNVAAPVNDIPTPVNTTIPTPVNASEVADIDDQEPNGVNLNK